MSLRARLLVAMVLIVAAGLLAADLATYRFLSTFLLDRVDAQLEAATFPALRALSVPDSTPPGAAGPDGGESLFPAGTWAAALDAGGDVVRDHVFAFGQAAASPPELPAGLPGSSDASSTQVRTFSAPAQNGDTLYRSRHTRSGVGARWWSRSRSPTTPARFGGSC